jgi:epoxyqueuosine reductase QueG
LAHPDGNINGAALRLTDGHDGALSNLIQSPNSEIQDRAIFARYARGEDYHDVMTAKLRELLAFIKERQPFVPDRAEPADPSDPLTAGAQELSGPDAPTGSKRIKSAIAGEPSGACGELHAETPARVPTEGRVYVDTGPILEREVARRAGLGWFGKNTMLINTRRGSYFFLGEIITNLPLPSDEPAIGGCGTCTRCIDACPTGAITAPYVLDATRCISYLTIELKGEIPEEHRPAIAATNRIYGCDICQEVCPFNRPATASAHPTLVPTSEPAFQPRAATTNRTLSELALLTEEEFRRQFKGSPVKRAKWRGLIRNVAAALVTEEYPVEW